MTEENKLSSYDFDVPEELIAQEPAAVRGQSRLLVLNRATGEIHHRMFRDIVEYLSPGDCLVLNKTRVVPARLFGKKESGGKVEVLFLAFPENQGQTEILALTRPFISPGKKIILPGGLTAEVKGRSEQGEAILSLSGASLTGILHSNGHMPLPPYIKRKNAAAHTRKMDAERYQTVYADAPGSIAAPTAGLHFTSDVIGGIRSKGVSVAEIILHVGWGTFKPVLSEDISCHNMLPEYYEISASAAGEIIRCLRSGKRVFASGTTSVRALESALSSIESKVIPDGTLSGRTTLFIRPGYKFKAVSSLLTNFHLPRSTPLFMVCAFAGRDAIFSAYREAVEKKYRFFSYGDAMLII